MMAKTQLLPVLLLSLAAVCGVSLGAKWHEDPRDDLVRNVFFTNKLTDWTASGDAKLKIETVGRYVYRLDVTASTGSGKGTFGVGQTITVEPETWYRLEARGTARKAGQAALFVATTSSSLVAADAASLPTGQVSSRHVDFYVPKGTTKVRVGVVGGKSSRGDKFSLSHVSVRKFSYSWLSNSSFRGGSAAMWHPLNHATLKKKANTVLVTTTKAGSDTDGPAGISQRHVSVLPGRRYRIVTRGFRAKGVKAMAFPRVYRANDDGFVAGPNSLASAGASLPAEGRTGTVFFDFTVPEGVDRLTVAVAFVTAGSLPKVLKGDAFEVESITMAMLPNQLINGDLDLGVKPWTPNGKTAVAASTDAGDRSLTATVQTSAGTPGIRIDNVPVVPGTRYHFEAIARTDSKAGNAYLWVQEPSGEDLHWVYRNGFAPSPDAKLRGIDFIAPRNVKNVNIGVLFSAHPTKFAVGDKIIVHSASLTGVSMPATFAAGKFYPELVGRYPNPPSRPVPPPPPPPVVITPPAPAKPVAPPAWQTILNTKQSAALTDNVAPAVENTYKVHPECRDPKMAWLAKIHPENVDACGTECETKFYDKGAAGDHTPYADYRLCYDCCVDMVEQYDGVRATGTAGKSWVPLSPKMFDSQFVKNFAMTYMADEDGKVTIKGVATAPGCGKGPGAGWVLFIDGDWTRIQYTEHFRGSASCNGVFGSMAYHYLPATVTNGLLPFSERQGDAVYDAHRMGGMDVHEFDGRTVRCDNDKDNWWHTVNGSGERRATANLRRDPEATRAGISTGVSCSNGATFEISDVYLWM